MGTLAMWIAVGAAACVLIAILARPVYVILKAKLRGEPVMFGLREASGGLRGKCPKCGAPVVMGEMRAGTQAFECKACGEKATWL
jgi:hypothetical protein